MKQSAIKPVTVVTELPKTEEKVLENPRIKVNGIEDEGRTNAWEYYVNQLYETDQFVGEL